MKRKNPDLGTAEGFMEPRKEKEEEEPVKKPIIAARDVCTFSRALRMKSIPALEYTWGKFKPA